MLQVMEVSNREDYRTQLPEAWEAQIIIGVFEHDGIKV